MRIFAFTIWTLAAVTAGYALFYVSYQVEAMEHQLAQLNREILKEQEAVHILEAEWSYLTRPDRLQKLSMELLPELEPVSAEQFTSFDKLPFRIVGSEERFTDGGQPKAPVATPEQKARRVTYKGANQ